jgi:hypothetical protein
MALSNPPGWDTEHPAGGLTIGCMVKLVGHILRDTGKDILFQILPNNGDAASEKLCAGLSGEEWFGKRQIVIPRVMPNPGFDEIHVPFEVANYKAQVQELRRKNEGK